MKAQKALHRYQEADKKRTKFKALQYYIFEKYDGWYMYWDSRDGVVYSRAGRAIPSMYDFGKLWQAKHGKLADCIVIFEGLIHGVPEFYELNGIFNRSKGECQVGAAYAQCHDFIFINRNTGRLEVEMHLEERYECLKDYLEMFQHPPLKLAPILARCPGGATIIDELNEQIWAEGGEGTIHKAVNAPYEEGKRNKHILKDKLECTVDLLVISLERGEGKYSDTLGALIARDKKGKQHRVSGMTDAERVAWWNKSATVIGKVIEVCCMKVNPDGSLREPRYKAIRYDKTVKDID